jgi:hypothetical protein
MPGHLRALQADTQRAQVDVLVAELARAAAGEAALTARVAAVAAEADRMHGARAQREATYMQQREADWQAALEEEGRLIRCCPSLDLVGLPAVAR